MEIEVVSLSYWKHPQAFLLVANLSIDRRIAYHANTPKQLVFNSLKPSWSQTSSQESRLSLLMSAFSSVTQRPNASLSFSEFEGFFLKRGSESSKGMFDRVLDLNLVHSHPSLRDVLPVQAFKLRPI